MKVYCEVPPNLSKAMDRVVFALKNHTPPGVDFVGREEGADLVILHVIGYPETVDAIQRILNRGQQYAMIQYCMRSTQRPHTRDWLDLWSSAKLVWSYYDLYAMLCDDGNPARFNFYCSPLGTDPIFREARLKKSSSGR